MARRAPEGPAHSARFPPQHHAVNRYHSKRTSNLTA